MKVTNMELFNLAEALAELMATKMPIKTSYEVLRLGRIIDEFLVPAETIKNQLLAKYGKEDPKTLRVMITPVDENWRAFMTEYGELCTIEHDIECTPIILPDTVELNASTLLTLGKFVTM